MTSRGLLLLALAALVLWAPGAFALNSNHQCSFCHDLHAAPGQDLLVDSAAEAVCLSCHGPAGISILKAEAHTNKIGSSYASFTMTCMSCHDPHDGLDNYLGNGPNLKMVGRDEDGSGLATIATPNTGILDVVFVSRGIDAGGPFRYSFADGDDDGDGLYTGVCEVCHTETRFHQNGIVIPDTSNHSHNVGLNCSTCHPHADHFWATGGSCLDCHNSPQDNGDGTPLGGRREMVSEFSRFSHHVETAVDIADCEACHDQSQHQLGQVRLKDVDDPTNPAASFVLSGDPHTVPAEAHTITGFCLACHDADGASGSAPFLDGVMPPEIDRAIWTTDASHNVTAALSCFGDGAFGCHASGHGSERRELLAPDGVAPTPSDNDEEDQCFACHDGDGPAATDVEFEFAKGTNGSSIFHHPVDDSEQSGGREAECGDCHNPHYATSASPWNGAGGVDLAGNPVAVGLPVAEYEVCLKCHGDTYNAGRDINGDAIVDTSNKRIDFAADASAFHAVGNPGRNQSGALQEQLIGGLTTASTLACSDCHNNEQTADAQGAASNSASNPQGPHGSTIAPILRAAFDLSANGPDGPPLGNFELCFLCHDQQRLVGSERFSTGARTNFYGASYRNLHHGHLVQWNTGATCRTCHFNSHGNQSASNTIYRIIDGGTTDYQSPPVSYKTRMVNFSPYVQPNNFSKPMWQLNPSTRWRSCDVLCHGTDHVLNEGDFTYNPQAEHGQPGQDDDPLTY